MKKLVLTTTAAVALFAAVSSYGQSVIKFGNDSANKITLKSDGTPIIGASAFRFGLYMGASGATDAQMVLVATAANSPATATTSPIAGIFNGGNPFTLPAGYSSGTSYAFQIRGWSYNDGTSYEAALLSGDANLLAGVSADGFVTPVTPPATTPAIFGTGPGQVSGFQLAPVPEPTTLALGGLGAAALLLFRRKK